MCCGLIFRCTFYAIAIGTLVCGLIVVAVGAAMTVYIEDFAKEIYELAGDNLNSDLFMAAVYMMIPVGTLLAVSCVFGCCGAMRSGACCCSCIDGSLCLLVFIISAAISAVLVLSSGVLSSLYKNSLDYNGLVYDFQYQVTYQYNASGYEDTTAAWDTMQAELNCCGGDEIDDYQNSVFRNTTSYNVPESCCVEYRLEEDFIDPGDYATCNENADPAAIQNPAIVHTDSCGERYKEVVETEADIVSGVCYAFGLVNLAGIFVACCIRDRLED